MINRIAVARPRPGTTLLELVFAILLIGILAMFGSSSYSAARDVLAIRAARDAIIAASARTRAYAVGHGGASLLIDAAAGTLRITTRDGVVDETSSVTQSLEVQVHLGGARAPTAATIPYDALGIGRIANRTISITRDRYAGGVTFSAYGRPRAW